MKLLIALAALFAVAACEAEEKIHRVIIPERPVACPWMRCPSIPDHCREPQYRANGCRVCDKDICRKGITIPGVMRRSERSVECSMMVGCPEMPDNCRRRQYNDRGCRICDQDICIRPIQRDVPVACPMMECRRIDKEDCRWAQYDDNGCRVCDRDICE